MTIISVELPLLLSVVSLVGSFYFFYLPRLEDVWRRRIESALDRSEIISAWESNNLWARFDTSLGAFQDFCDRFWGKSWTSTYKTSTRISIVYTLAIFLMVFVFSEALPFRAAAGDNLMLEGMLERALIAIVFTALVLFFSFVLKFERPKDYVGVWGNIKGRNYATALKRLGKETLGGLFALFVVAVLVVSVEVFLRKIGAIDLVLTSWISIAFLLVCFSVAYGIRLGSTAVTCSTFVQFSLITIIAPAFLFYLPSTGRTDFEGVAAFLKPFVLPAVPLFTLFVLLPIVNAFFDALSLQATRSLIGGYRKRGKYNFIELISRVSFGLLLSLALFCLMFLVFSTVAGMYDAFAVSQGSARLFDWRSFLELTKSDQEIVGLFVYGMLITVFWPAFAHVAVGTSYWLAVRTKDREAIVKILKGWTETALEREKDYVIQKMVAAERFFLVPALFLTIATFGICITFLGLILPINVIPVLVDTSLDIYGRILTLSSNIR